MLSPVVCCSGEALGCRVIPWVLYGAQKFIRSVFISFTPSDHVHSFSSTRKFLET